MPSATQTLRVLFAICDGCAETWTPLLLETYIKRVFIHSSVVLLPSASQCPINVRLRILIDPVAVNLLTPFVHSGILR